MQNQIIKLAHVALWTPDLTAAAHFWRTYFGATIGQEYISKRRQGFVSIFVALPGGGHIELMTGPWIDRSSAVDRVAWDHVAISVGSSSAVDGLAKRCEADGLLVSPPRMTGDGFYEAVIKMPDGTHIEITA